jgi:hypothetical protein
VAQVDQLRHDSLRTLGDWFALMPGGTKWMPIAVRGLTWTFVTSAHRDLVRGAAARVLRIR